MSTFSWRVLRLPLLITLLWGLLLFTLTGLAINSGNTGNSENG